MQLKLEKQVWVKKSFAYDNGSLVTFYSVKNSMKSGNSEPYICKVSEAVRKCPLLFLLFIMLLVNELE